MDLKRDGGSDVISAPAREQSVQRVVLINRTRSEVILDSSSGSGGGQIGVPPGATRAIRWRREAGPDLIRTSVRVPGEPNRTFRVKTPVR